MKEIKEILENISQSFESKLKKRHSYIVIGKAASGKSTLSSLIAEKTRCVLISLNTTINHILQSREPDMIHVQNNLKMGKVLTSEIVFKVLQESLDTEQGKAQGFVLEGLPGIMETPESLEEQLLFINSLVSNFNCVLVHLRISDQDVLRRRAAMWLDPVTNLSYPGQQILYSRKRRREGYIDGEVDHEYIQEKIANGLLPAVKKDKDATQDEEEEEMPEKKRKPDSRSSEPFKNQSSYPILAEKILERLVKAPENDPDRVAEELLAYRPVEEKLEECIKSKFNALQIVELDATQHPEQVFDQMKYRIESRGYSIYQPLIEALRLPTADPAAIGTLEADIIRHYCTYSLRDGEPERELSMFQKYCPVTLKLHNKLVEAPLETAAVYRGKLYFFASPEYCNIFITYPEKYICVSLAPKPTTLAIVGIEATDKDYILGKALAEKYKLGYINPDETIFKWEMEDWKVSDAKNPELQEISTRIHSSMKKGSCISVDEYVALVGALINENRDKSSFHKKENGWVLQGLNISTEIIAGLKENNILPAHFYHVNEASKEDPGDKDAATSGIEQLMRSEVLSNIAQVFKDLSDSDVMLRSINSDESPLAVVNSILAYHDISIPQAVSFGKNLEVNPIFGVTKDFCPVSIKENNVLTKGNASICAKFMGFSYVFSSEEARDSFCKKPYYYIRNVAIPPPRFVILGSQGSGKRSIISHLTSRWNIPVIDFAQYCANVHLENKDALLEVKLALEHNTAIPSEIMETIIEKLKKEEGWILTGFPLHKQDFENSFKSKFIPDTFLILQVEPEIAIKRKMQQMGSDKLTPEKKDKLLEDLTIRIDQQNKAISEYLPIIEGWGSVSQTKIQTTKCLRSVIAQVERELSSFLKTRDSMFTTVTRVDEKTVTEHLMFGLKKFSRFGKYCPVTLKRTGRVSTENFGTIPITYQDSIIYLKNEDAEKEMISNPVLYLNQATPLPVLASNCCILGNPQSGKSSVAIKLSLELNAVHLTVSKILQTILDGKEITSLCEKISETLKKGKSLSDEVLVDAVILIANRVSASGKGWIMDGFPYTFQQALLLEKAEFQPHYIFNLCLNDETEIIQRSLKAPSVSTELPVLRGDVHLERNSSWLKSVNDIKTLFSEKYTNWIDLDGLFSSWALKDTMVKNCNTALERRQVFLELKTHGKAAPCLGVGISNAYMHENRSAFKEYCPYELVEFNKLVTETKEYIAEYKVRKATFLNSKGQYFNLSSEKALESFLLDTEKYYSRTLPEILPRIASKSELAFPVQLELKGYCPVTFQEGPTGFQSIIPGNNDYIAEYNKQFFSFSNGNKLKKFMSSPWKYCNLKLPAKLPPPIAPIPVMKLPVIGYLEQSLASSISEALIELGRIRPKYPFKNLHDSANEFLGLYLKAHNSNTKEWVRKKHFEKLQSYIDNCGLSKCLLSEYQLSLASPKTPDLEQKVDKFISLALKKN